jgi:hypothetical protein
MTLHSRKAGITDLSHWGIKKDSKRPMAGWQLIIQIIIADMVIFPSHWIMQRMGSRIAPEPVVTVGLER